MDGPKKVTSEIHDSYYFPEMLSLYPKVCRLKWQLLSSIFLRYCCYCIRKFDLPAVQGGSIGKPLNSTGLWLLLFCIFLVSQRKKVSLQHRRSFALVKQSKPYERPRERLTNSKNTRVTCPYLRTRHARPSAECCSRDQWLVPGSHVPFALCYHQSTKR